MEKISREEYNDLIAKIACEILEDDTEKEAFENDELVEKEASRRFDREIAKAVSAKDSGRINDLLSQVGNHNNSSFKDKFKATVGGTIAGEFPNGVSSKGPKAYVKNFKNYVAGEPGVKIPMKDFATDVIKSFPVAAGAAGLGGIAAATAGGIALKKHLDKKKQPAQEDIINKAAELYVDALMQKQAAYEVIAESEIVAEAAEVALNKLGYSMRCDDSEE